MGLVEGRLPAEVRKACESWWINKPPFMESWMLDEVRLMILSTNFVENHLQPNLDLVARAEMWKLLAQDATSRMIGQHPKTTSGHCVGCGRTWDYEKGEDEIHEGECPVKMVDKLTQEEAQ